jgi:hypothetical protein
MDAPAFEARFFGLLDFGVVVVRAHVRGSGARGILWHLHGKVKLNFTTTTIVTNICLLFRQWKKEILLMISILLLNIYKKMELQHQIQQFIVENLQVNN